MRCAGLGRRQPAGRGPRCGTKRSGSFPPFIGLLPGLRRPSSDRDCRFGAGGLPMTSRQSGERRLLRSGSGQERTHSTSRSHNSPPTAWSRALRPSRSQRNVGGMYNDGHRKVQDRFDSRRIADRLEQVTVHAELSNGDVAFIEASSMFFLATAEGEGWPECRTRAAGPASSAASTAARSRSGPTTATACSDRSANRGQ